MTEQRELNGLYRGTVLDHNRNPRNFRRIPSANRQATGHNPLCGDKVTVYLQMETDGRISDAAFEAIGCAISLASASMLTERIRGTKLADARHLIDDVDAMFAGRTRERDIGDLAALAGVRDYPSRVRCATLPWRTLEAALRVDGATISTEKEI